MTKEQAISIMMESINADNKQLSLDMGISEEDAIKNIENSQQSLFFIMSNIYDKLVDAKIIA